jgi:CheY-like chemotaxis protein
MTISRLPRTSPLATLLRGPSGKGSLGGDDSINSKGFVLVVDDEPDIRELIEDTLRIFGYRTESAGDADQAIGLIRVRKPDVITLDLAMPRRDGHSLIRELGASPGISDIPIVVVSAYAGNLDRTPQIARVLWKPFDVDELVGAVDEAIRSTRNGS